MALAKEMMGYSMIERSPWLASSKKLRLKYRDNSLPQRKTQLRINPGSVFLEHRRTNPVVVAALSEDLIKSIGSSNSSSGRENENKAVKFKVRAVMTVRNKSKQDLKDTIVKHLDAFSEKIGRNVVLELISSTEIDPSKFIISLYPFHFHLGFLFSFVGKIYFW